MFREGPLETFFSAQVMCLLLVLEMTISPALPELFPVFSRCIPIVQSEAILNFLSLPLSF